MRAIRILAIIALVPLGCNKHDTEVTTELLEKQAAGEQNLQATQTTNKKPELATGGPAGEGTCDPVLKDYEYPNSNVDGTHSMGNTVSVMYKSPDDFAEVVAFYQKKFPGSSPQSGTNAYFGKTAPDGSEVTVTLTETGKTTQIILKRDKK